MKKILLTTALALTVSAQAQNDTIGVSKFTAVYLYECKTTNAAGTPITDSLMIAVQSANGVTNTRRKHLVIRAMCKTLRITLQTQWKHLDIRNTATAASPTNRLPALQELSFYLKPMPINHWNNKNYSQNI